MARRLERRLEQAALEPAAAARVVDVCSDAMMRRAAALADDGHFEAMHPARTLLVLLDDCDVRDARILGAAALVESEHAHLRLAAEPNAAGLAAAVPLPDVAGPELLEDLLAAGEAVRLIALAERLDHARHLHLRPRERWAAFQAQVADVYAPIAVRTHPRLVRRYAWWLATFRRRFLAG